jgi:hypothetical protein
VSATDPDHQALTYAWSAPAGWTLTPSASGTTASLVAPAQAGKTATITVMVTDTDYASATGSVLVGTADNLPPAIVSLSADAAQVLPGGVVHAVVSATDPDGDPLTYAWTTTDTTWTIQGTGTSITIDAPQQAGGSTSIKVTVSDGIGGTVSGILLLTTTGCPSGKLNCDKNDVNGCEVDSTTTSNCGACGVTCGAGEVCDHGTTCRTPGASCEQLLEDGKSLGDGIYFIKPLGAGPDPYPVHCDMTTDGGGWTGFFAGENGSPNSFAHFEQTAADCTDPTSRCLRRIPSSESHPEIMAGCGSARVGIFGSQPVLDYFINGMANNWQPNDHARPIAGGGNASFATWTWTGDGGFTGAGFILSDQNNPDTFGANYQGDNNWNYCNGTFDTSSPLTLAYRSRVDHFIFNADAVNQQPGAAFTLTLRAYDSAGVLVTGYTGRVHFTSSDGSAILPADYTFLPGDNGVHTFTNVTLGAASGSPTITVTDTKRNTLTATITLHIALPGSSSQPAADCAAILAQGASGGDGVYWLTDGSPYQAYCDMTTDGGGWTAFFVGQNGQRNVFDHFEYTANDCPDPETRCMRRLPAAVVTPEVLATCGTAQVGFFLSPAVRNYLTNGIQSQWQPLNSSRALGGGANADFTRFMWTGNGGNSGFIISDTIQTQDTFGSSYDQGNNWDFCNGVDDSSSRLALLYRSRIDHLELNSSTGSPDSGAPFTVSVRAVNRNGSTYTGYLGTLHFTSSDGAAVLPADYTFVAGDNGAHTFTNGVTINAAAGTQTVTATDTVTAALTASRSYHIGGLGSSLQPAASCQAILAADSTSGDGRYVLIDTPGPAYTAFCDMTHGGWTLLLTANGSSNYWGNTSANWSSMSTQGAAPATLAPPIGDYKSRAYDDLVTNEIKLCYNDLDHCYPFTHSLARTLQSFYASNVSYVAYASNVLFYSDVGNDGARTDYLSSLGFAMGTASCYWIGINHTHMGGGIGLMGDQNAGCADQGPSGGNFWLDDYALGLGVNSCNEGCAPTNLSQAGISEAVAGGVLWSPWFVLGR